MALPTYMIWELRAGSLGSGGWEDGGSGTDYSQQDNAQIDTDDWETKNLDYDRLYSSSEDANLVAALVGNTLKITAGTNFTVGTYHIDGSGSDGGGNYIDLDRVCASANSNDGEGVIGGAMSDLVALDVIMDDGDIAHIKSGTYSTTDDITWDNCTVGYKLELRGYNLSRDDEPAGDDRPLIQCGGFQFGLGVGNIVSHIRFTTTHVLGVYLIQSSKMVNVKVHNTSTGRAIFCSAQTGIVLIGCEGIADGNHGIWVSGKILVLFCSAHDCGLSGFNISNVSNTVIMYCEASYNTEYGVYSEGPGALIAHCTISNNTKDGIYCLGGHSVLLNNQITNNGEHGIDMSASQYVPSTTHIDYNNFYNNTSGRSDGTMWPDYNQTTDNPGYTDAANRDYSDVDDANALKMRLGVS